jgi:predicted O-methyltransferase YrrM
MDINRLIKSKLKLHGNHRGALPWTGWTSTFDRNALALLFNEVGYKVGAEIGIYQGAFSKVLCTSIPKLKLYCIDPWVPYLKRRLTQQMQDIHYARAVRRLKRFNTTIIREMSTVAVKDFADGSLDFVYIDAAHDFDNVMLDLINWVPKVRKGGIVSGHDYFKRDQMGVLEAVNAYTQAHYIIEWYITGHNLADRTNSFFWVR